MPFGRPCAHWAPRLLSSLAGLAWIMGHPRFFGVWRTVRGSQGTRAPMLFGGPCAHWAPRLLFGLACRAWNLRRSSARETVQLRQFGALCPPRGHREPAIFGKSGKNAGLRGCARKYTTFVQHLHVIMCLPMCVAMIDFNVSRFALENTWKRFEEQSDSSCFCKNCNVF